MTPEEAERKLHDYAVKHGGRLGDIYVSPLSLTIFCQRGKPETVQLVTTGHFSLDTGLDMLNAVVAFAAGRPHRTL